MSKKIVGRRDFLKATALGGGAIVFSACAAPAATEAPAVAAPAATAAPIIIKETVVVPVTAAAPPPLEANLIWDTFRGVGTGWNEERVSSFQASHPGVTIEFRPLVAGGQQDNYGKMYALKAAGDLGDIIAFDPSHYQFERAISKGVIGPIGDLVAGDGLDLKAWFEQFITIQSFKGILYGLPSWGWAGQDGFAINTVHFEEKGIAVPDPMGHDTSMATIAEWAQTFRDEAAGRWGLNINNGEGFLVCLLRAFNGDLISADGTKSLLMEKESVEALKWIYELKVSKRLVPHGEELGAASGEAHKAGKLTIEQAGSLTVRTLKKDAKDPAVDVVSQVLLPARKDGKFACQIRGGTWNINAESKAPEAAFQFIKHITNTEGSFGFNLVGGNGALVRPDTVKLLIQNNPVHEWFIPNLENGIPAYGPANFRGSEYNDAINQWSSLLFDPTQPVEFEKGLQDLHDNLQLMLDTPEA